MSYGPSTPASGAKPSALGWVSAVLLFALPLPYLLSAPPVFWYHYPTVLYDEPKWVSLYSKPYDWLAGHTPLDGPLSAYTSWWARALAKDPMGWK